MAFLSFCTYLLANHRVLLVFALPLLLLVVAIWYHSRTGKRWLYFLIPSVFTLGILNVFTGPWVNAAFLNWAGTPGTAIVVDKRDAGWMLNEQPAHVYDVLATTADGQELILQFDSMAVSIWPVRSRMLIPPINERFAIRYVPGFARNFVIMSDDSDYGRRWLLSEARGPLDRARRMHEASPANMEFAQAYQDALRSFLAQHGDQLADSERSRYEAALETLGRSGAPGPSH